ncbi:centrosome-associated protein CEP250-like isoform X2 [Larus michahellis]|uniref:centrosome-associated protein CEP250-like isoform X2 n=1 Tax=Larus michahellis TaxID=119627 RepID=UPI003D9AD95F
MAQELLQKEEQHTDTLKVREADHQGEINKLLQDVTIAEGQRLSWLSEKRLLSQRLERLQRAVARLDQEKTELKQYSAELRRTLEEVERERRRLRRCCRGRALPDAGGSSLSESDQHKMLVSQQVRPGSYLVGGGSGQMEERWQQPPSIDRVSLPQTQLAQDGK